MDKDGIIAGPEGMASAERSPDLSLAGVTLEMPMLETEMPSSEAIRQRFVQLTSLLATIIALPMVALTRLLLGPTVINTATFIGGAVYALCLGLVHLWSRRTSSAGPALALIVLSASLSLILTALNPTTASILSAPILLVIPVVAASSLLTHRWALPVGAITIGLAILGHIVTVDALSEPLREVAVMRTVRVVVTIAIAAAIGRYFSRGLSELIEVSRRANLNLAARARRQTALAHLGQRALSSFDGLARTTVNTTPKALDIDICAFALSDDSDDGRWTLLFADSRRTPTLTIPVGSALDGALHDDQPTLVGLQRELGDERLQDTRCLVVSTKFADGRRAALLACSRDHAAVGENEVPFLQTALSLLSAAAQRQEAETLKSRSEARYADLVKLSPDGILTITQEGKISTANPATGSIFGREVDALCGQLFTELGLDEDGRRHFASVTSDPKTKPRALWIERDDGSRRRLEINAKMTSRDDGEREIVAILRDITDRYHLEEQLRLSQRLESLGLLAGGVAHDFNNILTVVITSAALLRDEPGLQKDALELVGEIYDAGERAATLTNQLLAFSRKQVLSPHHVDLAAVIRELEKMLRRLIGEDIELIVDITGDLGTVYADPSQVEQALINLCVNARAAMPSGGLLMITGRRRKFDEAVAELPQITPGDYVHLKVSDNGEGMSAATQARIFEPFFTTKEPGEGTGLGLSMVHGFVQQSGGHIWPESQLGRGTAFHILLPADDRHAERPTPRRASIRRGNGRILVIEDEPLVRTVATRILKNAGYDVVACDGPASALERFTDDSEGFDLVVSDVVMPGMSGVEVIKLLRLRQPKLRAILVSGYPRLPPGLGVDLRSMTLLTKPFTPASLSAAVAAVLGSKETAGRPAPRPAPVA